MSIPIAQQLIRKLRSSGIKVWLVPRKDAPPVVRFTSLDSVPAALRQQITSLAVPIRQQLEDEQIVREARNSLRRRADARKVKTIVDVPSEQL